MPTRPPRTSTASPRRTRGGAKVVPLRPNQKLPEPLRPPVDPRDVERAFAQMAAKVGAADDVGEAHRNQLAIIQGLLQPRASFVAMYVPEKRQLQVTTVRGRNDARIAAAKLGEGPLGRAFSDVRIVRDDGMVVSPLLGAQGVTGCLAVLMPRAGVSDELMTALAAQVSAAAEVARLRDDGNRRNKDLQTAVAGLKSLEKNREQLLANVSHDLKNPLTAIKARLTLLLRAREEPLAEAHRRAVEICDRNADRLLRMINDLLLISRLQSGKMQLAERPFALKQLAEEVAQSLAELSEPAQVNIRFDRSGEAFIRGDRERMAEAIRHLIENAITHSPAGATVDVRVEAHEGLLARLTVTDQGPGMPPEVRDHLFDNFYRARAPQRGRSAGGLGLAIVARIIELHGGRVEVKSAPGEGSAFSVYVPLFAGPVSPTELAQAPRPGGILLVEDNADCREVLQQVLEEEGYRVMSATGAPEAMAILEHIRPAMVLLDLRLSQGDGVSVLHHIRGAPSLQDVIVYIVSGASDVASLTAGKGLDRIDGYFEKPLQLTKLLDTVASVVRPSRKA